MRTHAFHLMLAALVALATAAPRASAQPPAVPPGAPPSAEDAPTLEDFARQDRVVAAVLELPRDTPAQKLRTVARLLDLGREDAAAAVLPELLAAPLDDPTRAAMVREFGTARFMQLIRLDPLPVENAPASPFAGAREFAQQALDAAAAEARDPARLAEIIQRLHAPTEEERYAARVDLRATGDPGIVAAVAALAAATDQQQRDHLIDALAAMRPAVEAPVIALVAESRGQLRRDAIRLAARLQLADALPWLAALAVSPSGGETSAAAAAAIQQMGLPRPTPAAAQALIERRLEALRSRPLPANNDVLPETWWSFDPQTSALAATSLPPGQARTLAVARLTRALAEAGGIAQPALLREAIIAEWEEAAVLGREPSPLTKQWVGELTPAELSAALAESVAGRHWAAAIQAAAELGRRGDASVLATADGRPSPLADAVASPVRELRFAALTAIMNLAPSQSFPGASYVPTALWHFAAGAGDPLAIVAAPSITRASDWAGRLRAGGFQATPVQTGRDALLATLEPASSARLALVVLDSDIGQPLLGETLFQLRGRQRTARMPVLILASVPHVESAQRLAASDPHALAAPRPTGDAAMAELVERALGLHDLPPATPERRREQAIQALDWIARLLREGGPYDELRRDAALVNRTLFEGDLAEPSLNVLAVAGTADSQLALVDFASAPQRPVEARRRAVDALATNVQRHGVQLTADQILRQYDRYNASETADADTQQVLGAVLDVLERK